MRYFLLFLLLSTQCGLLLSQNKTQQKITQLEHQRFEAMTQKNIPFLKQVLGDDMTYAHSNGLVENKEQHLKNISSGNIIYEVMKPEKMDIRAYKKTAVVNGVVAVKGLYKGTPFNIRLGYTDVYMRQKRRWKLVAWQSVKLE